MFASWFLFQPSVSRPLWILLSLYWGLPAGSNTAEQQGNWADVLIFWNTGISQLVFNLRRTSWICCVKQHSKHCCVAVWIHSAVGLLSLRPFLYCQKQPFSRCLIWRDQRILMLRVLKSQSTLNTVEHAWGLQWNWLLGDLESAARSLLWKCSKWDHAEALKKRVPWEGIKKTTKPTEDLSLLETWERSNECKEQVQKYTVCARCSVWCWLEGSSGGERWSFLV